MTIAALNIVHSFKCLSDAEKKEVAAEIFRLTFNFDYSPMADEEFVLNAEELFLELDRSEAANG